MISPVITLFYEELKFNFSLFVINDITKNLGQGRLKKKKKIYDDDDSRNESLYFTTKESHSVTSHRTEFTSLIPDM